MAVMRNLTPVFPQTYGWDSSALLDYASEPGQVPGESEEVHFRWLVEHGFIRILLLNQDSIWNAALNAFRDPRYRNFGARPELGASDPEVDKQAVVEYMCTGKCPPGALPTKIGDRLEALKFLSDDVCFLCARDASERNSDPS